MGRRIDRLSNAISPLQLIIAVQSLLLSAVAIAHYLSSPDSSIIVYSLLSLYVVSVLVHQYFYPSPKLAAVQTAAGLIIFLVPFFYNVTHFREDPASHSYWVQLLMDNGSLTSEMGIYQTTPGLHSLFTALLGPLGGSYGLSGKYVQPILMGLFLPTSSLVIARELFLNDKIVSLSVIVGPWVTTNIQYSHIFTTQFLSIVFVIGIAALFLGDLPSRLKSVLMILILGASVTVHAFYSAILITFFAAWYLSARAFGRLTTTSRGTLPFIGLFAGVFWFLHGALWGTQAGRNPLQIMGSLADKFLSGGPETNIHRSATAPPLGDVFLTYLPLFAWVILGVIGALISLRKKPERAWFPTGLGIVGLLSVLLLALGLRNLRPVYFAMFIAPFCGVYLGGFLELFSYVEFPKWLTISVVLSFLVLGSISAGAANALNPVWGDDLRFTGEWKHTQAERAMYYQVENLTGGNETILTDLKSGGRWVNLQDFSYDLIFVSSAEENRSHNYSLVRDSYPGDSILLYDRQNFTISESSRGFTTADLVDGRNIVFSTRDYRLMASDDEG